MISLTLQKIIALRFWKFFLQSYVVISLIWIFSICVRLFIRQEIYSLRLLAIISLSTLPSIIAYITCLAAMFTVINFGKTHELKLMTLMGISRRRRFGHFLLAFPAVVLLAFLFESSWKPMLKVQLNSPTALLGDNLMDKLPKGMEIDIDNWLLVKTHDDRIFMSRIYGERSTAILSSCVTSLGQGELALQDGVIWPDLQAGIQCLQFGSLQLPLEGRSSPSAREKQLHELDPSQQAELNQILFILRNAIAPLFLLYLGIALGHFALVTSKGTGFLACLVLLLAVYFPLQILGRKLEDTGLLAALCLQLLPLAAAALAGHLLNRHSERRGYG